MQREGFNCLDGRTLLSLYAFGMMEKAEEFRTGRTLLYLLYRRGTRREGFDCLDGRTLLSLRALL